MTDDEIVTTTDLIFETTRDSHLDKNRLWELVLNLDHRLHKLMTVRVELWINLENWLLDSLGV